MAGKSMRFVWWRDWITQTIFDQLASASPTIPFRKNQLHSGASWSIQHGQENFLFLGGRNGVPLLEKRRRLLSAQCLQGIDTDCAQRWDVGGEHGSDRQKQRHAHVRQRVGRCNGE